MLCHFFFSFLISFVFSKNALVVVFPFYQNKNLDLAELIRTTVNETNVRQILENLLQTTVSNYTNNYPIEISLNNSNITFDDEEQ